MNTYDLAKIVVNIEKEEEDKKGSKSDDSMVNYFNNLFGNRESWMENNKSIVSRINSIIGSNQYITSCNGITSKTISGLNCDGSISIQELFFRTEDQSRKIWDRLKKNITIRASKRRLEIAVLLTTALAKQLRDSQAKTFESYYIVLKTVLDILEIEFSNETIIELCPFNYMKAYKDWQVVLNGQTTHSDLQLEYYDILCCTIYLAVWKQNVITNEETIAVCNQWKLYVSDYVNNYYINKKTDYEKREIRKKIFGDTIITTSSSDSVMPSLIRNNELYRDPRFLRQANLYRDIDMKAIHKVLSENSVKDLVVLDLGCGDGEVTCSRFGKIRNVSKIIAIDKDKKQLMQAKDKAKEQGVYDKILFLTLDMDNQDFTDQLKHALKQYHITGVDIIFAAMSLHSTKNPEKIVGQLAHDMLNEGGFFIIREVDDGTKIYYSKGISDINYMLEAADEYKKMFGFTDRNCARKVYSWLINQGMENVEIFYDVVDTCNKSIVEKNDIFYVTQGFRKVRAENELARFKNSKDEEKYADNCRKIIDANEKLQNVFYNPDFWFCFTNYIAIAQKKRAVNRASSQSILPRDIEIMLIRHAEGDYDQQNLSYDINENGFKQITKLSEYLQDIEIDEVYCSSMKRAIETARPIAISHDIILKEYSELNEIDRGRIVTDAHWNLDFYQEYYKLWKEHKYDMEFPNGENGESVWLRAKYIIDLIVENARKSNPKISRPYRVCVVTHGGTIRSIICGMLNIPQTYRYQFMQKIDNCSISVLKIQSDFRENPNTSIPVTLESLNNVSYFER